MNGLEISKNTTELTFRFSDFDFERIAGHTLASFVQSLYPEVNIFVCLQVIDVANGLLALPTWCPTLVTFALLLHYILQNGTVPREHWLPPGQFDWVVCDLINFQVNWRLRSACKISKLLKSEFSHLILTFLKTFLDFCIGLLFTQCLKSCELWSVLIINSNEIPRNLMISSRTSYVAVSTPETVKKIKFFILYFWDKKWNQEN